MWASVIKKVPSSATAIAQPIPPPSHNSGSVAGGIVPTNVSIRVRNQKNVSVPIHENKSGELVTSSLQNEENKETKEKTAEQLEQEALEQNLRPTFTSLIRPGAPVSAPIFSNSSDLNKWDWNEETKNRQYSDQVYHEKVAAWEEKNSWHPVPKMDSMTKEQEEMGFFRLQKSQWDRESEAKKLAENKYYIPPCDYGYLCPYNSTETREEFLEFLQRLMYNRAQQLCACKTVGEFEKVYLDAVKLEYGLSWKWQLGNGRGGVNEALWALSVKANLFPGKQVKPLTSPTPTEAPKQYNVRGVQRGEVGVCGVKDIKKLGKSAPIRWYISPTEMRNMKKFEFSFETNPRHFDDDGIEQWWSDEAYGIDW